MDLAVLEQTLAARGEPRYRAKQVWEWVAGGAAAFDEMTNLPAALPMNPSYRKQARSYNEPGQEPDYSKDTRVPFGLYGISYSPADGSIWGSSLPHPGYIIRIAPGSNP